METAEMIITTILFVIAMSSFVISYFHFKEKGFLLNNAYIYASGEERKKMDKRPHYKQSSIVFFFIGIIFLLNAIDTILKTGWLFYIILTVIFIVIIYAVISSIKIEMKKK